jgi:hypothetical protein
MEATVNWSEVLSVSAITTAGVGVLAFMSKEWLSTRLKESVAAEYKQAMELFKQRLTWEDRRKQQAIEIAELFSLWLQQSYDSRKEKGRQSHQIRAAEEVLGTCSLA